MPLMSLKDLYVAELADLADAESQGLRLVSALSERANAPELKELLAQHVEESRLHAERLQLIFTHLGEAGQDLRCAGVAGIVQEADERLNQPATPDARDAAIIGMVQRIEHYEIAAYGCARSYARRLNRTDEARLLHETLEDERRMDRHLSEIADAHVNDDARSEADLHERPPARRLRYVGASQLDYSRLASGSLAVRNDADEALGRFDGLVLDASTNHPRYIVVDGGGVFSRRRFLLPVASVRFDQASRVLRVDIDKTVAERYPEFDAGEFQHMSEEAVRGYEARLIALFAHGPRDRDRIEHYTEPEWLMTGVWIPLTADRAADLAPGARGFANEFLPDREQAVARESAVPESRDAPKTDDERATSESDAPTPPHGEKLR